MQNINICKKEHMICDNFYLNLVFSWPFHWWWSIEVKSMYLVFGIYQGFYSSAEGCPNKTQGLLAGTLLNHSFRIIRLSWPEEIA